MPLLSLVVLSRLDAGSPAALDQVERTCELVSDGQTVSESSTIL
ncbi:MAG: hypothetical protein U0234_31420 [Sandaracinus sp.]